jgi:hypothetical protein
MSAPYTATATLHLLAGTLAALRADLLLLLHAEAEAAGLPQSITMGLHWICEDAASTLADLHNLTAPQVAP